MLKIVRLRDNRIGHLAANTDIYLRSIQNNNKRKKGTYLGIANISPANKQLLKMFQRVFPIIQIPGITIIDKFTWPFINRPLLAGLIYYQNLRFKSNEYHAFKNTNRNLYFTKSEEKKGKKLLEEMGILDNNWFVCFHSRDPTYLSSLDKDIDSSHLDFRDCKINNYLKAAKYIAKKSGFAIRMGHITAEKLSESNNPKIIDYASNYRSDFGDIYLSAKCKFFIGNTAGIFLVSQIFEVPIAGTNFIPFHTPLRKGDIFIPKKVWSIKKDRVLTIREMLKLDWKTFLLANGYKKVSLKPIENTAEEILDLTKEMNGRLDGTFDYTEEDHVLQKRFRSLIKPNHHCYGTPARIGALFLRKNKELLK